MRKETYHLVAKTLVTIINIWCPVDADCVFHELSVALGYYCPQPGTILHSMAVSQCKLKCLQSVNCEAFNHNSTDNTCTLFAISCPVIISNLMMKYAVFGPNNRIIKCYEWVPYVPTDPLDERMVTVDNGSPLSYMSRIHADGNDAMGFVVPEHGSCYSCVDPVLYNSHDTHKSPVYPCQILRISSLCKYLWVPYTAGDPLPDKALIGGQMAGESQVWIAKFFDGEFVLSGYYTTGSTHAFLRVGGLCKTTTTMEILILDWIRE